MEVDEERIATGRLSSLSEEAELHLFTLGDLPDESVGGVQRPRLCGEAVGIGLAPELPQLLLHRSVALGCAVLLVAGLGGFLWGGGIDLLAQVVYDSGVIRRGGRPVVGAVVRLALRLLPATSP